jgi:hypothetical protein
MSMTINEFLQWLFASGGAIMAASWIMERIPKFHDLVAEVKEMILFASSSVISVSAYLIFTYVSPEILAAIAPYFTIIGGLFVTIIIGKIFHKIDKTDQIKG